MTLNGVIALTSPNRSVISPNSVAFGTDYVKVVEDKKHQYFLQCKCRPKNLVFSDISFMAILAGDHLQGTTFSESVKVSTGCENRVLNDLTSTKADCQQQPADSLPICDTVRM